jgi:peptidoglycan/xylan/chitin deacetylase (PgdA/CDA1 family)
MSRIVLTHGDGGNRTQTVEALETVLKVLSEQGYTFAVVCQ